jgi:hypothetical protein
VDDIDKKLSDQLKQFERETIEVLLSWESSAQRKAEGSGGGNQEAEQGQGYVSTKRLVDMLDDLGCELEMMEAWLSSKGDALKFMQNDMLEIEAVSHSSPHRPRSIG